jgi:hypothetical protein
MVTSPDWADELADEIIADYHRQRYSEARRAIAQRLRDIETKTLIIERTDRADQRRLQRNNHVDDSTT